jgi:hypothetical protein
MPKLLRIGLFLSSFVMVHGGTLTSGSFTLSTFLGNSSAIATVSGDNFTARVVDLDAGPPFMFSGFPPLGVGPTSFSWVGGGGPSGGGSFVDYDGIDYSAPFFCCGPLPGLPFANVQFTELLIGTPPTITGPGFYPMTFSLELDFSLFDSSHQLVLTETDTAFATGGITYIASGLPVNNFVSGGPLQGSIPEPSTLSYYLLAGFCLALFARIRANSSPSS